MTQYVCPKCCKVQSVPDGVRAVLIKCGACEEALHTFKPAELNDDNIEAFITQSDLPVVVKVEAQWCGPCKMMKPAFDQVAAEIDTLLFTTLDIEKAPESAAELGIRGVPAIIFFYGGKEVARDSGLKNIHQIKQWLVQTVQSIS